MLFDNNDYSFLDLVNNQDNNTNMYTVKEGFLRGNMFRDEYLPYKNYSYININPKSDREAKLYNVMQYEFAINDLNLYLDIHPNDEYAFKYENGQQGKTEMWYVLDADPNAELVPELDPVPFFHEGGLEGIVVVQAPDQSLPAVPRRVRIPVQRARETSRKDLVFALGYDVFQFMSVRQFHLFQCRSPISN